MHKSVSAATTWSSVTIDSSINTGVGPAVVLGNDGFALISYYNGDLQFIQCTSVDCSTKNTTTLDTVGDVCQQSDIALGNDGYARISYFDFDNKDLKFVQCTNASCSSKNITTVDSTGDVGRYTSIGVAADGYARISYMDATNANLKFVQCTNASCSTNTITTVASTGFVGYYTSLALGSDNFARIAYYNVTNGTLDLVQCTNASCSTSTITAVDTVENNTFDISLALSSNDFARISYYETNTQDLQFAQCTNIDCSSNTITTIDSIGAVGIENSLVLSSDGYGRIAYRDITNNYLKFVIEAAVPLPSQLSVSSAASCSDTVPSRVPDLFQIDMNNTQATLYYVPAGKPNNKYAVIYGFKSGEERFGSEFNQSNSDGVLSYTINSLVPNTTYYFRIRGGNGCMPGGWSNEVKVTTTKTKESNITYYKNFPPRIGTSVSRLSEPADNSVLGIRTDSRCEYTVLPGDNLWNISKSKYGTGTKYTEIVLLNNLDGTILQIGQKLKVLCI